MKKILNCRRTMVSLIGITCLTGLGVYLKSIDVASSITTICLGVGFANAGQAIFSKPKDQTPAE